jgi:two-component sensor histidine kinase
MSKAKALGEVPAPSGYEGLPEVTVKDAKGRIVGASKIVRDITERKRAVESLAKRVEEQSALYAFTDRLHRAESLDDIYEAAFDAVVRALRCERASILLFDNAGVMRFVAWRGLSDDYRRAVDGHSPWTSDIRNPRPICIDDIERAGIPKSLRATVRAEGIRALVFIPLVANGKLIGKFMAYYRRTHVFADDELDLALTIARQLGFGIERQRAEEARNLLVAELSHRVKNTLATVISIARQSFSRGHDIDNALRSFDARIRALAQTHGRLAEANWSGVPLESILLDELAPYRRDDGDNVRASGPSIMLSPRCAVTLGMAIHELATNAAKYGALSSKSGSVNVAWQIDWRDRQLQILWTETGGPAIAAPGPGGFGRLLLERALTADLQGHVELDFADDGLKCHIDLPLDEHLVRTNSDWAHP